ncbi:alpha/beta hydrolase [Poseidonocella sp. HB161398]|uniref:PHA/PHB synthase family protein n=1 Tax=Poseidonocella sp. HB161398 TaxID=2320855 RepID=UPI001108DBE2|nr:alpha/beta fold hydrolase [Poseidonocella sp. HB161398]
MMHDNIAGADSHVVRPARNDRDREFHAAIGRYTGGLSPAALGTAALDWWLHLLGSPNKQTELYNLAWDQAIETMHLPAACLAGQEDCPEMQAMKKDRRFSAPGWEAFPFNVMARSFLKQEAWWNEATRRVHGTDPRHERIVNFAIRQILDTYSPSNCFFTNPAVLAKTREEHGQNILRGLQNWFDDLREQTTGEKEPDADYKVGEVLGVTPGEVVLRNELMELIRYTPQTAEVRPEPLLIVPAWIMKYYILDLEQRNSMVKYLLEQGFEVYMISWKNPTREDAEKGMDDYVRDGALAALDFVSGGTRKVHTAGYCLGGTLLSATAAHVAHREFQPIASVTLLAAQVDFTEAGELSLFISESQVAFLEDIMKTQGYLGAEQMAGAFTMLRSNDLFWSRIITQYMMGQKSGKNALMAWNADSTRMPARMHTEYLRGLFLENQLARGQWRVLGHTVNLNDIKVPAFAVGTETDHVAPWRSVYKFNLLTDTDVTFVLTSGGHNAGIVSEPGHPRRHFRIREKPQGSPHLSADSWMELAETRDGSWWEPWAEWLGKQSSAPVPAPEAPPSLGPAPGTYVFG